VPTPKQASAQTSQPKKASRQTSTTAIDPSLTAKLLRAYLVVLALFEVPMMVQYVFLDKSLADGFSSNLADAAAEKRTWTFMLALLVLARAAAAIDPSPTQLAHCAAVHVVEAVAFGAEYFLYGSGGEPFIVFMVLLNAVLFTGVAARKAKIA